ncbi:peptide chain release factor N(5)-glutamine methyltransferase [Aliiglaciecola sp. LCG003]|uniref:peptide chain release factor N(5)-glutamine methyltransferase n=1 Tax=Aliiglaciecola sp. LCG003 TaxID=3053655 RepID=UPI00257474F0|nr:peptide chain release factor N(5)-glutamine methyltransferase [Aliiglaciecola sp. LCG003]WJG08249.1 peptide chain release factor N(5)-glutamine methyltransferase [Aliiglaciecola sp. LCG003]
MSIQQLLDWAIVQLALGESPRLDARILLSHCTNLSITQLMTWPDKSIDETPEKQFRDLVQQRKVGHPVAHLIGYRDFWTLSLNVTPDTLIPRPETELLIEQALQLDLPREARVLDLGTGTGAIALSLASEQADWQITGADFSAKAVQLAKSNGVKNHLEQVTFLQSNWFEQIPLQSFDLIVSNPPYVESDSPYLAQGDVRFEPASALTSGSTGLDDITQIVKNATSYLSSKGWLMLEHGLGQAPEIAKLFLNSGYQNIFHAEDLNGVTRISAARKVV